MYMGIADRVSSERFRGLQSVAPSEDRIGALYASSATDGTRLAYALVGDRALAEELVQEAFVRLYARFRHRSAPDALETYMKATIVNLARSHGRRRKRERGLLSRQESASSTLDLPDVAQQDSMWQLLLTLPVRQRAAIFFRYYEDMTYEQIARALQCSTGAVKSLLMRGLRTLREKVGGESDG